MQSFDAFLAERGKISNFYRPHYLRWAQMYEDFLRREGAKEANARISERFLTNASL